MVSPIVLISGASGRSLLTGRTATETAMMPSIAQAIMRAEQRAIDVGAAVDHQESPTKAPTMNTSPCAK